MDETPRPPEQIPQTIGRYQVQNSIGYGAMGAVYRAFDPLIKRTLAIKTIRLDIPRQSPQYKSFIERFYHEARISGTLSHPNIVTLFDIGEEVGVPYLAMEYVEGETLSSILERGVRFPPEQVIGLISQIASAVDYAHSKGVIHRDIKPSNLILYETERVKVTDFGIAKLVDADITHSGTLLGTPSYMSPEQAMGDRLDGRSDIFSLGVCAFEMLSGEQPFPGTNVTSILYKLVHVDPIEPANLEMNGLVPQKWHEVFGKVLAKRPNDRYQTATDFVQDLEYCLGAWFGLIGEDHASAGADAASAHARPGRSDESTGSFPVIPLMPGSPAVAPDAAATDTLPPGTSQPDAVPATVMLRPGALATAATIKMSGASPRAGATDATYKSTPPASDWNPAAAVTEKVSLADARAVAAWAAAPPPAPRPPDTAQAAIPAAGTPVSARRTGPRIPAGVILGLAGVLAVAVVVLGMVVVYRRLATPKAAAPLPPPPPSTQAAAPVPQPSAAPVVVDGVVHVESDPPGATVTVDAQPRGVTPLDVAGLALGSHDVGVELKGYEPSSQAVVLSAESPRSEVTVALTRAAPTTGSADIHSQPFGAMVSVDGKAVGYTPLTNWKLRPGNHKVQITKDGHEPWSGSVAVQAGKRARVEAQLTAVPKPAPQPTPEVVDPSRIYEVGDIDVRPQKVSGEWAAAPKLKGRQRISVGGTFVVGADGEVTDIRITESGGKVVDESVAAALRKWKYAPGTKRGVKVKVRLPFKQTFTTG